MNLNEMASKQINTYAQKIITGGDKADEVAFGKINFYAVLRRVANNQATLQDLGMLDAINDTLQTLGFIEEGKHLTKLLQAK